MKKYLRQALFILSVAVLAQACMTTPDDVFYDGKIDTNQNSRLTDTLEQRLVENYIHYSTESLNALQKEIQSLLAQPSTEYDYTARLHALNADVYLLRRSSYRAKKEIAAARALNEHDEYVLLVQSRLISSLKEQQAFLEPLVQSNSRLYRLRCELGGIYAAREEYTKAVIAFDASLPFLPEPYTRLYEKQRSLCYARSSISNDLNETTEVIIAKKKMSLVDMTTLAQENSGVFDFITGGEKWKASILAKRLKNAGWYGSDVKNFQKNARRKDSARFLWHLLNIRTPEKLRQYSQFYRHKNKSPVSDVPVSSENFDAVLGIIEADIMKFVTRNDFQPNDTISGLDFYKSLEKALKETKR